MYPDSLGTFSAYAELPVFDSATSVVAGMQARRARLNLALMRHLQNEGHASAKTFDDASIAVLTIAEGLAPNAFVRALSHPHVSRLLVAWTRETAGGSPGSPGVADLNSVVAAAGFACGLEFDLDVAVDGWSCLLPGLGATDQSMTAVSMKVAAVQGRLRITDLSTGRSITVDGSEQRDDMWRVNRRLRHEEFVIELDEIVPFEGSVDFIQHPSVAPDEFDRWQQSFIGAVSLMAQDHRGWFAEVASVFRTLSPLLDLDGRRSMTSVDMFGSCALTLPPSAVDFAETLVHECQHNKFNVLLEIDPMMTGGAEIQMMVDWRPDPRPLLGVLHGIYSFYGIAGFWSQRMDAAGSKDELDRAVFEFERRIRAVDAALDGVLELDHLTGGGRELFTVLRNKVDLMKR